MAEPTAFKYRAFISYSHQALDELRKAREIITRLSEQSPENAQLPKDLAALDAEIEKLERPSAAGASAIQSEGATTP
jgi:hypothetical protein